MKLRFLLVSVLTFYFSATVFGQLRQIGDNSNGWFMYMGDHKVSEKWGVHLEAQVRRSNIVSLPQQLLLRPGINYHFNNQVFASAGYAFVETHPYGKFPVLRDFSEHRIWEQIQIKNQLKNVEYISRFRLEQRYVHSIVGTVGNYSEGPTVYSNRFRLLQRFSVPLKGQKIEDKSLYLTAYDEFFVNFGKQIKYNIFDQNRAYIALGYKLPNIGRLELGYMNQLLVKSDGIKIENNHTLAVSLNSNIDFFRHK
jgi:hypothetical protein